MRVHLGTGERFGVGCASNLFWKKFEVGSNSILTKSEKIGEDLGFTLLGLLKTRINQKGKIEDFGGIGKSKE